MGINDFAPSERDLACAVGFVQVDGAPVAADRSSDFSFWADIALGVAGIQIETPGLCGFVSVAARMNCSSL